jgi:hypothetical protein
METIETSHVKIFEGKLKLTRMFDIIKHWTWKLKYKDAYSNLVNNRYF